MRCFLDGVPIDPRTLTPAVGTARIPPELVRTLRIQLERDELLARLDAVYAGLVEELRADIAKSGNGPDDDERLALDSPTLDAFLRGSPEHVTGFVRAYLWSDLLAALFDSNPEPGWAFVVAELEAVIATASDCTFTAAVFPVQGRGNQANTGVSS